MSYGLTNTSRLVFADENIQTKEEWKDKVIGPPSVEDGTTQTTPTNEEEEEAESNDSTVHSQGRNERTQGNNSHSPRAILFPALWN